MINFVYVTEQGVVAGVAINEASINVSEYLIVERQDLPLEPIEAWVVEDGQVKIDKEKAVQIKRQQMTALTKRQFNLVMYDNGLLTQVKELLSQDERTQIEFDSTDTITRLHPTVIQLAKDLGLTEEKVDVLWTEALAIN
ncbi:hypothetical protein ACQUFW_00100 [Acinetobacter johnsonii]|jgi:hypothetical protein|uniref:hypothetical protein n=1 Tax=Acinetobacter johnsonii TaxID=40214 RepID=UPI003D17916D